MDDSKLMDLFVNISTNLGQINAKMSSLCETIAKHESRITDLEKNKAGVKDNIVKWLVLALIASVATVATLTGSSALVTKIISIVAQ